MSGLMKSVLAAALTLPLVAFVAGVLASPETPEPDRARPVIIGNVGDDVEDGPTLRPRPDRQPAGAPDPDPPAGDGGSDDDDDADDDGPAVVIPPPRNPVDDGGVGDDDGDDDETDDETDDGDDD